MRQTIYRLIKISLVAFGCLCATGEITKAQVTSDGTVNTTVKRSGNVAEINGGQTRGDNLFHSFKEFSVPTGNEAHFNNATTIENIFSRVTGGNISNIDGLISANGSASLFLINPAGILFGEGATLDIGGSFIGSTADSILFPNDLEFSASDTQPQPILTINAPIGLGFRDNPGDIVNRAIFLDDGGTPNVFEDDDLTGLRVAANNTLALIGGNVFLDGGFVTTPGGRIELGSVAENSTLSLTKVENGWDIGYEDVKNFQDINLAFAAFVESFGEAETGDIQIQGRNISVIEGSQIAINSEVGQAGNLSVIASESLEIDGNATEVDLGDFPSFISQNVSDEATGAESQINIETPKLSLTNGGQLNTFNFSTGKGANIVVTASDIRLEGTKETDTGIFAQIQPEATGQGGNITLETTKLTANGGAQISSETFGAGNTGNITIDALESIELNGAAELTGASVNDVEIFSSGLFANVGRDATGNSGKIMVNTPRLALKDGAQITSVSRNQGNGGDIAIDAAESVLLSGTSPSAKPRGGGRSLITVGVEPAFETDSGEIIFSIGSGGQLNLKTKELIVEQGAAIAANTFSLGNGGNLDIDVDRLIIRDGGQIGTASLLENNSFGSERGQGGNLNVTAKNSVEIIGTGNINNELVISKISTLAEGTGDAGDLTLSTDRLTIKDGADIDAKGLGEGTAGDLNIEAQAVDLTRGKIIADTSAGQGGNITLNVADILVLQNNSLISAQATGDANGGNITVDSELVAAFPTQMNGNGNDIIASAEQGQGGNIDITTDSLLGFQEGQSEIGNETNDIDASSQFGLDGNVTIAILDVNNIRGVTELPDDVVKPEQTTAQVCQRNISKRENSLNVKGRDGVPSKPDAPLNAEMILVNESSVARGNEYISQDIQTSTTNLQRNIIPAQGIKVTHDGRIILTALPEVSQYQRASNINCL